MKQKILIVVATKFEIEKTIQHFNLPIKELVEHRVFDILITGVGMTATAFALGRYLHTDYRLVLNIGIAGSFDLTIPLGSLVEVNTDSIAELGAEDREQFLTIDDLGFGTGTFSASASVTNLTKVHGITVNTVHGNETSIALANKRFSPQTESMEGAAVFYACQKLAIPCAQVRSISNFVTPRNKKDWKIELAIQNLSEWLIEFLTSAIPPAAES